MAKDESSGGGEADISENVRPECLGALSSPLSEGSENSEASDSSAEQYSPRPRSGRQPAVAIQRGRPGMRGRRGPLKRKRPFSLHPKPRKRPIPPPKEPNSDEDCRLAESLDADTVIAQRFLYHPGAQWPDLSSAVMQTVEIRIAREYVDWGNKEVAAAKLWGTDVYSSDSDIVAVLQHCGLLDLSRPVPPQYEGIAAHVRVSRGRNCYLSSLRNRIRSKRCFDYEGHSIKPEKVSFLASLGTDEELHEMVSLMPGNCHRPRTKCQPNLHQQWLIPCAFLTCNLSSELWRTYTLEGIGDISGAMGLVERLRTDVLYVETTEERFELAKVEGGGKERTERYRWSVVRQPLIMKDARFMSTCKLPLDSTHSRVLYKCTLHTAISWREIHWGSVSLQVKDIAHGPLVCFRFYSLHS